VAVDGGSVKPYYEHGGVTIYHGDCRDVVGGLSVDSVVTDPRILPLALHTFQRSGWKYLRNLTLYRRWGQACKLHGWMSTSDFVLLFQKPGAPEKYHGKVFHDVFVKATGEAVEFGHPAQKPAEFVGQIVSNLTPPDGTVLDPYMGSGTTLRAALDSGRRAIGIEIEERYSRRDLALLPQILLARDHCRRYNPPKLAGPSPLAWTRRPSVTPGG
jgi:hypothetical protein